MVMTVAAETLPGNIGKTVPAKKETIIAPKKKPKTKLKDVSFQHL
jgi:hypothetical protein